MGAISGLFKSRKFYVGLLTILSVFGVLVLRIFDKITSDAMAPTMAALAATGLTIIGSIAWEDVAQKRADAERDKSQSPTVNVNVRESLPPSVDVTPPRSTDMP